MEYFFNKKTICFLLLIFCLSITAGEEYFNKSFGYYVNYPEGWKISDESNPALVSFADETGAALFQVFVFTKDAFSTVDDLRNYIKNSFKAEGDEEKFKYQGDDAIMADYSFSNGKFNLRGYFVFIKSKEYSYVLAAYSTVETEKFFHYFILSCIDSFSIDRDAKLYPGPVNQYYFLQSGKKTSIEIPIDNKKIAYTVDQNEVETTMVLIERESKIMAFYANKKNRYRAWLRYYKMIYKDNYQRVKFFTGAINSEFGLNRQKQEDVCKMLVSWVQGFTFVSEKPDDILSPLDALTTLSGDCDSKALLLNIIFDQLGIDSIMVVSEVYKHAGIILNIRANGAYFTYNGKKYYFAELNAKVDIGKIDRSMADESNWIAMPLREE